MKIKTQILIQRVEPDNRLIAPHWIASWERLEGSGHDPQSALAALLARVTEEALSGLQEPK